MSNSKKARLKKLAPHATLASAIVIGVSLFAVATTARGASHRAQAAGIDIAQTCSGRVPAQSQIDIQAVVQNTGDEALSVTAIDADAGTPDNTGDDFNLTYQSGDLNGNNILDVAEEWTYAGTYTGPNEDVTNIVGVDAVSVTNTSVSDLAPCETDIIQAPVPGVIAGVKEVSGKVLIRKAGSTKFIDLNGTTEIAIGSQVDTLRGTIALTAGLGGGQTNTANFYQGLFTIQQKKARGSFMTLRLDGGSFRNCGTSTRALSIAAKSKRPVRKLWGSGKGKFTTRGRYSSATVRGTKWLTQDRCDGTLTRVLQGVVKVQDFRARKTVSVRAGRSYLARAG